ncbi:hypothetical protein F9B85_08295 [Heliorestis acidaminivorans]|uniref:Uncharacterized protein n=1 Tax=Heliorestis acidaminivorans TaxID=553427 RepID=A0A6I0F0N8_9FIRM|nr:hypothetical protein [Heliorestis acidaminivorans]KAB2952644.1 hypothetical protein F9B85_08295 [Heliorestis acidaminivorans]
MKETQEASLELADQALLAIQESLMAHFQANEYEKVDEALRLLEQASLLLGDLTGRFEEEANSALKSKSTPCNQ